MVGIVLVCHSNAMTDAFLEFCEVLKQEDFPLLMGEDHIMILMVLHLKWLLVL